MVGHVSFEHTTVATRTDVPTVEYVLRARTAVLVHNHRILLGWVEVGRFHDPAVQLYAVAGSKGEEFLARQVHRSYLLCQFLVVYQCGKCFAGVVVNGNYRRSSYVRECIDVILHALAEDSLVGTFFARQLGLATLCVYLVDCGAERASFITTIIIGIGLFVPTQETFHFKVTLGDLLDQVSAGRI